MPGQTSQLNDGLREQLEELLFILRLRQSSEPAPTRVPGPNGPNGMLQRLRELTNSLHPVDLGQALSTMETPLALVLLQHLEPPVAAQALRVLTPERQHRLLRSMTRTRSAAILRAMPDDELADLVGALSEEQAAELLRLLNEERRAGVEELLAYPPDTAGGRMTSDFIALSQELTARQAIQALRQMAPDSRSFFYLYVVDRARRLVGVLPLRELVLAEPSTLLRGLVNPRVVRVRVDDDQETVAQLIERYNLLALPVVDDLGRLVGVITADAAIDVIHEEASEDLYRVTGAAVPATGEEDPRPVGWARLRLPWLLGLLVADVVLTGSVISRYSRALEAVVALAFFIPVITDMGGNVGTQSFALVIRSLARGELRGFELLRVAWRELRVGALLGVACGAALSLLALAWQRDLQLGLVLGASLGMALTVSAAIGAVVPLLLHRAGADPAVASGAVITTVADAAGLLIYFWMATTLMDVRV